MYVTIRKTLILIILTTILFSLISCGKKTGNLLFTANGEEFIINGLVSREGWTLDFDQVILNLNSPEAYNPENPELIALLQGNNIVDLKRGTSNQPAVPVGIVPNVQTGNYQSLKFSLRKMDSGEFAGYSIVLKGNAEKGDEKIPFLIKLDDELTFNGREGYVGDSIKGILREDQTTEVEMTFHFDHLFGNIDMAAEDHVNSRSPGFDLFLSYKKDNAINVEQNEMRNNPDYYKLIQGIETLGHLGEGHCEVSR